MSLTFISGNEGKVAQLKAYLNYPFTHQKLDLLEIQSLDLETVVEHKVKEAYKIVQSPVLVEDTSLTFLSLGKLPGTLIKWFLQELKLEGLCKILNEYKDRSALAKVCFGFYDGKILKIFEAEMKGTIAPEPRGNQDFGWGPTFIPEGYTKTWGEMDLEEQKPTAIRRIALEKLAIYLKHLPIQS